MTKQHEPRNAVFIKKAGLFFGVWYVHQSPSYMSYVQIVWRYKCQKCLWKNH